MTLRNHASFQPTPHVPWKAVLVLLLCNGFALPGCITTLGYVPDNMKVRRFDHQPNLVPGYDEVKDWSYDVADGYDSRCVMNRYAGYAGATVALAAVGTVAGLAAFDASSGAITGLPLAGAFFAGIAGLYNNEDKAVIYGLASGNAKGLIDASDKRLESRLQAVAHPETAKNDADQAATAAESDVKTINDKLEAYRKAELKTRNTLSDKAGDAERTALEAGLKGQTDLIETTKTELKAAKDALALAKQRQTAAEHRVDAICVKLTDPYDNTKFVYSCDKNRCPSIPDPRDKTKLVNSCDEAERDAEALCLRTDVNNLMYRVGVHIRNLDPSTATVVGDFNKIKAPEAKATTEEKPADDKKNDAAAKEDDSAKTPAPAADLSDLKPPYQSACAGDI